MHILINGWFWGEDTAGSGQYLHHMLQHLPSHAPDERFTLAIPETAAGQLEDILADSITLLPLALPSLPRNLAKLWWEQVTIPGMARQIKADGLWIPYWAAPYWQPCPTVVTIHDLIPALLPDYQGGRLQKLYTALVSHTAKRAQAVLTVSHASARDIVQHLKIPADRVHAVHHGPNQEGEPHPSKEELAAIQRKYNLPERFFLYLGGFDVRKNVPAIVQAYGRYLEQGGDPAVRLVIAGKLPEVDRAFSPDPRRAVAELDLQEQVHFCGWVDDGDKSAIYALALAYIFPSHYEGFGMMVLEAMAAGTALVTSGAFKLDSSAK